MAWHLGLSNIFAGAKRCGETNALEERGNFSTGLDNCIGLVVALVVVCLVGRVSAADASLPFDTNQVMSVELKLQPSDWKTLRYQHRAAEFFPEETSTPLTNPYSWFAAEAVIDGRNVGSVQVRKKGYIGSNDTKRPALKVRLPARGRNASKRRASELTLNNNNQDPSLIRQSLAYEIFRQAEIPAPRCAFAHVSVNGTTLGIYTRVEPINESFLEDHFGRADGNLYEGGRSDFRSGWCQNFEIKNKQTANPRADLEAVTQAVEATSGSLLPVLERYFDAEKFFRFWAVESLINQGDGYAGNMNNFYLYHQPTTDKFVFIPWGADTCFYPGRLLNATKGDPKSVIGVSILPNRLYRSAEGADRYRATLRRVLKSAWNEKCLVAEVNRLEALLSPHLASHTQEVKLAIDKVRQFIKSRRLELEPELDGPAPELKSKPLDLAKRRNIGHFEGVFSTVGDNSYSEPSATNGSGEAKVKGKLWDQDIAPRKVHVQAGGFGGSASSDQPPVLTFTLEPGANGKRYALYLSIDPESLETGVPIPIDNTHIFGGFIETNPEGQGSKIVGMLRGRLLLRTASREPKGRIEGEFRTDVFSKLPKP
jgi:hypothetical protein